MRRGDISNSTAPYVYFHLDRLLIKEVVKEKRIFGIKLPSVTSIELNREFARLLDSLWSKYDVNIVLFSMEKPDTRVELEKWLFDNRVTYNRLEFYPDAFSLRDERYMYLFTDDDNLVSVISRKEALHINEFPEVFQ